MIHVKCVVTCLLAGRCRPPVVSTSIRKRNSGRVEVAAYSKSSGVRFAWRRIDLKVPIGTCFRSAGTIAVNGGSPDLRILIWLPFCETDIKPLLLRIFTIVFEE